MAKLAIIDYSNTSQSGTQTVGQVRISVIDPATGNPVNGDNIVVAYIITTNGVDLPNTTTIPGQWTGIWTGVIRDTNPAHPINTSFRIVSQSEAPDPAPPVNQCDLVLRSFENSNESFIGANDAVLTVNATSSYGPIEYSLDNITFQSSKTFIGLSGGVKTVWLRDANPIGCAVNGQVTIQTTANLLTKDPSVDLGGGKKSRWNAAFNPIVFQYQRKDYEVSSAVVYTDIQPLRTIHGVTFNVNGDLTILVNAIALQKAAGVNGLPIYVYINTTVYKGIFKVLAATISSVSCDAVWSTSTTGFMNSDTMKPYYKIYTQITFNDPITGQPGKILISKNSADATGLVKADFKNFTQSLLQIKDDSDYTEINFRDSNLSASYQIAYAEHWEDGTIDADGNTGHTSDFIPLEDPFYVIFAARQLGDKYGGNLAEFVPFPTLAATKWLTDFKEPVYSLTFPFDLGFIYSENVAGLQLYSKITLLDINRQVIGGGSPITTFLLNEDGSFLLNEDGSKFIIGDQSFFNTPIVEHVGLNRLLIDNDFADDVYFIKIGIFYDDEDSVPHQVVADQIVRIDKNCDYNSVYLRWIGLTGSWNYFRFIFNQEHTLDVQNAQLITRYVDDWENEQSIEDVISKSASEKVQVHAVDMSVDDIKGCQSMKFSPKVQILTGQNPLKWQTVIVNTASFAEYETNLGQYEFALTFNMPSKNIQTQ